MPKKTKLRAKLGGEGREVFPPAHLAWLRSGEGSPPAPPWYRKAEAKLEAQGILMVSRPVHEAREALQVLELDLAFFMSDATDIDALADCRERVFRAVGRLRRVVDTLVAQERTRRSR